MAAKVYLNKIYTICSIYLPHNNISRNKFAQVINQLTTPFLILGDMNARSPIWGDNGANSPNRCGGIFEQLLSEYNVYLLNTDSYTHYHCQTDTYSIIDLSICSSDCTDEFNFSVNQCLHGSDHYPIHIYFNQNPH